MHQNGHGDIETCLNRRKDDGGQTMIVEEDVVKEDFVSPTMNDEKSIARLTKGGEVQVFTVL